jgi:hypothetical protein
MRQLFRKALRSVALSVLAALGGAGTAHATLVVGVFDPNFGGLLSGANFSGTATFTIAQSCLDNLGLGLDPTRGVFIYSSNQCNGQAAGMSFVSADVNFTGTPSGQVHFGPQSNAILGMYVFNHQVIGVQSQWIGPSNALTGGYKFDLLFGQPSPMVDLGEGLNPSQGDNDHDYDDMPASAFQTTSMRLDGTYGGVVCPGDPQCVSKPATTRFVPEPGSMALVLGALTAGWLAAAPRRRKTALTSARPV